MSRKMLADTVKLVPFADSVWTASTPIRCASMCFPHVMSVVRLDDGQLLLHSPCKPSASLVDELERIGTVGHVVAPNWFHDLYLPEFRALYRRAMFWGPARLRRNYPEIIDCELNQIARPPWWSTMPHFTLPGLLTFDESIFFHTPSKTLIVADLFTNVCASASDSPITKSEFWLSGLNGGLTFFPYLRWFGFTATRSLQAAARQILVWHPDRLILGHGSPVAANAAEQLRLVLPRFKVDDYNGSEASEDCC